ncbi:MAG: ankyrin repeat domain-containing protein [Steroidobacteraceae bacterium]
MVKLLIGAHADVNARSLINTNRREVTGEPRAQARPPGGMTALLYAARQGCLGCVRYLNEGHADLNLADPEGITPMLIATRISISISPPTAQGRRGCESLGTGGDAHPCMPRSI